jgi:hypothetical protein
MVRNDEELHEVPYASVIQYLSYPSPTQKPIMNSSLQNLENGEGHSLTHLYPSQGLHDIPFHYSQLHLSNDSDSPIQIPDHKSSPNSSSNSNNNSGKAKDLLDDRKKKRMFSNRESARRSRMRKKQRIEVLWYQVNHLQALNHQLSQKIIYLLECNQLINQQNAQLKDKVSSLQAILSTLLVTTGNVGIPHHIPSGFPANLSTRLVTNLQFPEHSDFE